MGEAQDEDFFGVIRNHRIEVGYRQRFEDHSDLRMKKPFYLVEGMRSAQTLMQPRFPDLHAPKIAPQRLNLRWVVSSLELP